MIVSRNIDWKEVQFKTDKDGCVKPKWSCPFCKEEVFGFECDCGAKTPGLVIKKDYKEKCLVRKL